jgi:site-specific recombinase XerD
MTGAKVVRLSFESPTLIEAAKAFLAERDLADGTWRKYGATLGMLAEELGVRRPVAEITGRELVAFLADHWGQASPATWNRQRATLRSFFAYCRRQRWLVDDPTEATERKREPHDDTRAIPHAELEALWSRRDVALREKALWRLLYESAARAQEVLDLDVGDVDLPNRRAKITGKGGHTELIHFQTGAARLLARLLAGRQRGPVFLASKSPSPARAPAALDTCPDTGRARLSYRRAEELFKAHSGGRTLHQLRHSALTDLAAANVSLPLLMAKSRHRNLRSLQRYTRPGQEAVAALTAEMDPERRRRP